MKKSKSAEQNLIDFLKENYDWYSSGSLQRMPFKNRNGSLATPRTLVRRLQENATGENAVLEVKYEGRSTYYRIKETHRKVKYSYLDLPDGTKKEVVNYV